MKHALYTLLEPLGLYRLRRGSLIDAELAAYQVGLDLLEEALCEIRAQAFVQSAEGEGLRRHEWLVGLLQRRGLSTQDRRSLVLYRLSTSPSDFTLEGMTRSVLAAGMEAEITENWPDESLTIVSRRLLDAFADLDAVKQSVERMLPAHLRAEFDIGVMTWDMFDALDPDWDRWDALDFDWSAFDLDGHNLFARGGDGDAG